MTKQADKVKKIVKYTGTTDKSESNRIIKAVHKNEGQQNALRAIDENKVTILSGCAGTGKTFIAVSYGLQMFMRGKYKKLVFTRPAVEAGEHLGFLPGDATDKVSCYFYPIMDILSHHLSQADINDLFAENKLIILPIAFMRGITFLDSYVVLDEAQNCTPKQLHMFFTRMGEGSKVVVTGDPSQSDIAYSGLSDAIYRLEGVKDLEIVTLDASCVVRDPIVAEIDVRYANRE